MRRILCVLALLLVACGPIYAQTQSGVTGTWQVEGDRGWQVVLRTDGSGLTGMVSDCAPQAADILEGKIDENTITFQCKRGDGVTTIAFTGTVNGDEIAFTWHLQLREGSGPPPGNNLMFGASAPPKFTARRVPDGDLAKIAELSPGIQLYAAVNLTKQDVKAYGILFLPEKVNRARAVIAVIAYGNGLYLGGDLEWEKLAETTDSAFLLARFSNIGPSRFHASQGANPAGPMLLLHCCSALRRSPATKN
jgi:hypothetical protein